MKLVEKKIEKTLKKAIEKVFPDFKDWNKLYIQKSSDIKFGDFQTNFAMINARFFKTNPRIIAEKITSEVSNNEIFEKVELAGPGFINFYLSNDYIEKYIKKIGNEKFDFSFMGIDGDVIIDYSSPNIAKRMHIGHLGSTVIGDSIKRIYKFIGFNVIADNHLGDWGTPFGMLVVAYNKWLDENNYKKNPVEELERLYVKFRQESENDESLMTQAREIIAKIQNGDEELKQLWKEFVEISLLDYKRIYKRLNIDFDTYYGESFYHEMMPNVINNLKEKKIAVKDDGALVVFFEDSENLHPCIVKKKDGGFLYSTSDIATMEFKMKEYDLNKVIYVTDNRQGNHFKQVFKITDKLGWDFEKVFVPLGIKKFKDGIFSSRKGNVIKLEDFIDKSVERISSIIEEKNPNLSEEEKKNIAEVVGIGAIKYIELFQNRNSDVIFDWEKMLSFEGNTGPYLQYTYARIQSILRKSEIKIDNDVSLILEKKEERELAGFEMQFPNAVYLAAKGYEPNKITDYLYTLCKKFNTFYNTCPILKSKDEILKSRLLLAESVAKLLKIGLDLCGIEVLDRM